MRTIIVEPYSHQWPSEFQKIKTYLASYINDIVLDIIHVGSTSVPGLAAKPIIDFNIIIDSYKVFPLLVEQLKSLGYEHNGDGGIPMRERFKRSFPDDFLQYHMYVCPKDSPEHHRHLLFRDYLRNHDETRDEYARLKQELAEKFRHDIDAYIDGKHDFIESIIMKVQNEKKMSHYEIKKLDPDDYGKCNNIWNMSKNPEITKKWYDEIVSGNRIVFIYIENGEFIGEGALVFENGDRDYTIPSQRIYISRMIVKPDCQNRGIGGIILNYLIETAKQLGYKEISLGVDKVNVRARHLYEKKGFSTIIFDGADEHGEYVKLLKMLD